MLWASADTIENLHESIAALANSPELDLPLNPDSTLTTKIRAMRDWLAIESGWLFIFDNADSSEAAREIERFLPAAHGEPILIITSQFTDWTAAFRNQFC